jgi:hypothetical protein
MAVARSFIMQRVFKVRLIIEHDIGIPLGETYNVIVIVVVGVV